MTVVEERQAAEDISIVTARQAGDRIVLDLPDETVAQRIDDQEIIIARGAFQREELLRLRSQIRAWGQTVPVFPSGESASRPFHNFHRLDDGSEPSILPHIFHIYGFGDHAGLPNTLRTSVTRTSSLMLDLQNRLAGTSFELESGEFKTSVLQHPRGGGYIKDHVHPYLPQKVAIFLNLSEPGADYQSGEARFKLNGRWPSTFADFRMGDIMAWRYDLVHGVSAIEPDSEINWDDEGGFWLYALEMVASHPRSRTA